MNTFACGIDCHGLWARPRVGGRSSTAGVARLAANTRDRGDDSRSRELRIAWLRIVGNVQIILAVDRYSVS